MEKLTIDLGKFRDQTVALLHYRLNNMMAWNKGTTISKADADIVAQIIAVETKVDTLISLMLTKLKVEISQKEFDETYSAICEISIQNTMKLIQMAQKQRPQ
jgi:hypothetical protein